MFSGIKSLLFGYSESDENNSTTSATEKFNEKPTSTSLVVSETSTLLEQTLNAATTKFTEQLLPQSASIEQLQSSSHQILPTLVEQHEEDEKRKQKEIQLAKFPAQSNEASSEYDGDEDDDCFNAETWEMLDLNETQLVVAKEATSASGSNVSTNTDKVQENFNNKQTGGILKQRESVKSDNKASRQESKVSFKTPDLVKDAENEKIDLKAPKNNKKNKKNRQVKRNLVESEQNNSSKGKVSSLKDEKYEIETVLDYRAAAKNAVKRNRPESWSSGDELATVESTWKDKSEAQPGTSGSGFKVVHHENVDDNDSILSSGFSDCDYGYGGLNDFVMRPKKASNNKRRGQNSTSNVLLSSMSKRGNQQALSKKLAEPSGNAQAKIKPPTELNKTSKSPSRNIKPKKKKINLTSSTVRDDFLKKRNITAGEEETNASSSTLCAVSSKLDSSKSFLAPSAPVSIQKLSTSPLPSSTASGNDSSDIAEMDESWYVTPPPCFTGSSKFCEPTLKPKESSARENALIEHPSIYLSGNAVEQQESLISLNSTTTTVPLKEEKPISLKKAESSIMAKRKSETESKGWIVNKLSSKPGKVSKVVFAEEKIKRVSSSSQITAPVKQVPVERKAAKAWENKFIVTNWNQDEQDDINDFDNLFETSEKKQATVSKRSNKLSKQKESPVKELPNINIDYESDELSEVSSSPAIVGIDGELVTGSSNGSSIVEFVLEKEVELKITPGDLAGVETKIELRRRVEKRAPTLVKPIEPERQPGWQLRRKRSKRRPLSNVSQGNTANLGQTMKNNQSMSGKNGHDLSYTSASECSSLSSARSSPSLIDRIGSSIVANLTNLTNGFQNGNTLPHMQHQRAVTESSEKFDQSLRNKTNVNENIVARRRMSKSYLNRQNDCVKLLGNSKRRADRRLKMYTTPNGVSINRKVQTNFNSDN